MHTCPAPNPIRECRLIQLGLSEQNKFLPSQACIPGNLDSIQVQHQIYYLKNGPLVTVVKTMCLLNRRCIGSRERKNVVNQPVSQPILNPRGSVIHNLTARQSLPLMVV